MARHCSPGWNRHFPPGMIWRRSRFPSSGPWGGTAWYSGTQRVLDGLWAELSTHPEVALKRQLWDGLLREVQLTEGEYFTTQRKLIRRALSESGVAAKIDALVERLLA